MGSAHEPEPGKHAHVPVSARSGKAPTARRSLPLTAEQVRRAPKSSAASLVRHATGWAGNDLQKCLREVYDLRGKSVF